MEHIIYGLSMEHIIYGLSMEHTQIDSRIY